MGKTEGFSNRTPWRKPLCRFKISDDSEKSSSHFQNPTPNTLTMKNNAIRTFLITLSLGCLVFSESKAEQLNPEEMAKFTLVNRAVRKENPQFDVARKAFADAYREAVLRIDPSLSNIVDLKKEDLTPEQKASLGKARKEAEKADPTLLERARANT
jgi:hypothetical protein